MSMGTKLPSGMFNTGYTQPYGSSSAANMSGGFGAGTYDPMLGFGQASGMGTTFNYPTRYSADYTRYAQSGQPFNQPVMGYNSYGQIFAQPQRPPPTMGKGGSGFRPQPPSFGGKGGGGFRPQPPAMGGKGGGGGQPGYGGFQPGYGYQPQFPGAVAGGPGFQRINRRPERRSNQLGLNNEPSPPPIEYPSVQVPANQTGPVTGGPGATPPPLTGGVPNDFTGGFGNNEPGRPFTGGFGNNVPEPPPVQADRQVIDENIYNSPFGQLFGGLGGMPSDTQVTNPNQFARSTADRVYDPTTGTTGPSVTRYFENPAYQQQLALSNQQRISDRAPPGMMRNPNYSPAASMLDDVPMPGSDEYLRRQAFIPADGGLGGMVAGRSQDPNLRVMGDRNFDMPPNNFQIRPQGEGLFGRAFFQEGGQVPLDAASNVEMMMAETEQPEMAGEYDRLIQMTMQAILGQVESPDEVIQMFIDEFGVDAFRQLRDAVLKQQVPNAQTEGMVDGNGGGMDDQVMGMIGNQRPVAVSPGEYIVPADVVSGLGDGSSQAGADILDELNQAVRMTRTGTTQQPRPLMETLQQ